MTFLVTAMLYKHLIIESQETGVLRDIGTQVVLKYKGKEYLLTKLDAGNTRGPFSKETCATSIHLTEETQKDLARYIEQISNNQELDTATVERVQQWEKGILTA